MSGLNRVQPLNIFLLTSRNCIFKIHRASITRNLDKNMPFKNSISGKHLSLVPKLFVCPPFCRLEFLQASRTRKCVDRISFLLPRFLSLSFSIYNLLQIYLLFLFFLSTVLSLSLSLPLMICSILF